MTAVLSVPNDDEDDDDDKDTTENWLQGNGARPEVRRRNQNGATQASHPIANDDEDADDDEIYGIEIIVSWLLLNW